MQTEPTEEFTSNQEIERDSMTGSKSDFWLMLHHLVNELEKEGDSQEARVLNLISVLHSRSPATKAVYCENIDIALEVLVELKKRAKPVCGDSAP